MKRRAAIATLAAMPFARASGADATLGAAARRALELRDEAVRRGDQPYGAVVVSAGRIVGEGVSAVVARNDQDAHAERVALADAAARLGPEGVKGALLVGSSRACSRCAEAARRAGIARLWHGDPPVDDGAPYALNRSAVAGRRPSADWRRTHRRGDTREWKERARQRERRAATGERVAYLSLFTVLRQGPGPSSMHSAGPWLAARQFVHDLSAGGQLGSVTRLGIELYGGAACIGREALADSALVAGLSGVDRAASDASGVAALHKEATERRLVSLDGRHRVRFDPGDDIGFRVDRALPFGGSAVRFAAFDAHGTVVADRVYVPVGDDEIVGAGDAAIRRRAPRVPYDYEASADALVEACRAAGGRRLSFVALANEGALHSPGEVRQRLLAMATTMRSSVRRGCLRNDALPSGRKRTAASLAEALDARTATGPQRCRIYALAAAEENAAGEATVAAPSHGAAGVVAALLEHVLEGEDVPDDAEVDFLATAGAVGALLRRAGLKQVGCQGEVGVAAAMAAAGMASAMGATPAQALHAAELALEPHLGLACDPIGGRIESPCIERNGLAAARACAAATTALHVQAPRVALDAVVRTMVETSRGLAGRYKQASLGGVALSVPDC